MSGADGLGSVASLPCLEDDSATALWTSWDVTFRDVTILDSENGYVDSFNLTTYSLAVPDNYETLKGILLEAAGL